MNHLKDVLSAIAFLGEGAVLGAVLCVISLVKNRVLSSVIGCAVTVCGTIAFLWTCIALESGRIEPYAVLASAVGALCSVRHIAKHFHGKILRFEKIPQAKRKRKNLPEKK